uniref:Vacuolar protein sorting-associated protein 33-like protein n=1 Tax=Aegilops tauschii subsp. strangulata TaxID=200361 RepID=A0A453K262_AEGTS
MGPRLDLKRGVSTISGSSELLPDGAQQNTDRVGRRSVVLVVFVGGVTFAEIAALRFLGAQEGMGYDFVVATTKVITGNTLLRPIIASSKQRIVQSITNPCPGGDFPCSVQGHFLFCHWKCYCLCSCIRVLYFLVR